MFYQIGKIRILTNASFSKIGKLPVLKHILIDYTLVLSPYGGASHQFQLNIY